MRMRRHLPMAGWQDRWRSFVVAGCMVLNERAVAFEVVVLLPLPLQLRLPQPQPQPESYLS